MKTLHRNEHGIAHLALILVVVVVLGIGGAGYYVFSKQKKDGSSTASTSETNKALEAECKKEMDDKDFCKFVSNWKFDDEQKMVMTSSDGSVITTEKDASGSTSMVTTKNGADQGAYISIGNTSYMKNPGEDTWTKFTSNASADDSEEQSEDLEEELDFEEEIAKDTTKYTKKDKEACGNLTCFKYEITDTTRPGEITTIWFDDDDYQLRRMNMTGADSNVEIVLSYEVKTITAPSPVVDMPDYSNMTAEQLEALSQQFSQE